jgi:hypothetical protein
MCQDHTLSNELLEVLALSRCHAGRGEAIPSQRAPMFGAAFAFIRGFICIGAGVLPLLVFDPRPSPWPHFDPIHQVSAPVGR